MAPDHRFILISASSGCGASAVLFALTILSGSYLSIIFAISLAICFFFVGRAFRALSIPPSIYKFQGSDTIQYPERSPSGR